MALITRISRLFQADLHAVLDRIEEPDLLLRQAVREMEDDLARDEQGVKVLNHQLEQLISRETDIGQSLDEIEDELDVCFQSGKDDLARALIKRKLEALRFQKFLSRKREVQERTLSGLRTRLQENRGRLDSMRQKAELLAEETVSDSFEDNGSCPDIVIRDEDVEVAFLLEKQKRSRP
jgi:phage shock protein A